MLILLAVIFFGFILLGMPVAFSLGLSALAGFLYMGDLAFLSMIPQQFFSGMDLFPLMAIPFFILAGEIMNRSEITGRLVDFSGALIGHIKGGTGHVNILASIFMAGVSGSAVADTSALGAMLIPAMEKEGYPRSYSAAITAASSIIGPIIPPSIIMVVYGSLTGVSIAALFAGGILPGLLMGALLMIMNYYLSAKNRFPQRATRAGLNEILRTFKRAIVALMAPFIIVGGILGGIFTATEAAALAVGYCFFIGFFVIRTLKLRDLPDLLFNTVRISGVTFIIVACAAPLAWFLTNEQVPQMVAEHMLKITSNKFLLLLIINCFMLLVGLFMDVVASMIILSPILAPMAEALGVHPIHFGIIITINLCMALVTPPVGACLFVACGVGHISMEQIVRRIIPFIIAAIILLLLVTYFPIITLFVPRLLGLG